MSQISQQELVAKVEERAVALSRSLDSKEAIARQLTAFLKEIMPERLSEAMWITLEGDPKRDEGIKIRLYEKPMGTLGKFKLRFSGLVGRWSVGADVSTDIYQSTTGIKISAGLGVAAPYEDLSKMAPILSLALRF